MSRTPTRIALVLLLLCAPAVAAPRWWNRKYGNRKKIALAAGQATADIPCAFVRLAGAGRAKPDGSDIRITTMKGKEVPRAVVARGPGDLFEVTFPVGGETEWYVYYGNPEAEAPDEPYAPDRGLVLETRARGPGDPSDWSGMRKLLVNSTHVYGGSYWPRVFDAHNPFGPSDNFVSIYRGFLFAPADGAYTFYTASDEASFLFVGDDLVAQWPGWHSARKGAWGTFRGSVELTKGFHRFRYYHVERTGNQVMAAYWRPPGAKKAWVIPPTAFPGPLKTVVVEHEVHGKRTAADFSAEVTEKWGMNDRVWSGVTLKATLAGAGAEYAWDFGDGTRGEGPIAYHVFLEGGDYDVALTVRHRGESDVAIRTIHVPDDWTRLDRNRPEVLARFTRIVASYPAERLSFKAIERTALLFTHAGKEDLLAPLLRRAVARNKTLTPAQRHSAAMRLGAIYRDGERDLDGAVWAFRQADHATVPLDRIKAQTALAEAMIKLGGDAAVALRLLEKCAEAMVKVRSRGIHVLRIRLRSGDARMILGEGAAARADYTRAEELAGGAENVKRILRKAGATRSAVTLLEAGDTKRARESLSKWEMNAPLDRYTGLHRIVTAKLLLAEGAPDLAIRELAALVAGNPESEYADQALFLLAGIERDRGDEEKAREHLERLKKQYPWSPLAK